MQVTRSARACANYLSVVAKCDLSQRPRAASRRLPKWLYQTGRASAGVTPLGNRVDYPGGKAINQKKLAAITSNPAKTDKKYFLAGRNRLGIGWGCSEPQR